MPARSLKRQASVSSKYANFKRSKRSGVNFPSAARVSIPAAIRSYVKRSIQSNVEKKIFNNSAINQSVVAPLQGTTGVSAIVLVPGLAQGPGQAARIGNQVKVNLAKLDLLINLKPYAAITNTLSVPICVRCILLRYKLSNALASFTDNNFFQAGSASAGFTGTIADQLYQVNTDLYDVFADKTFSLFTQNSLAQTAAPQYIDATLAFQKRLVFDCTRQLKTLMYNDNSTEVTNTNLYLCIIPSLSDGSSGGGILSAIEYHYHYNLEFQDA